MLSMPKLLPRIKIAHSTGKPAHSPARTSCKPVMRSKTPRAHYYLDASWHTRKSFRALKQASDHPSEKLNAKPDSEQLAAQMDTLLWSIRPELQDDGASKALYLSLLSRQLNAIDARTMDWLAPALKQAKYECYVTETIIDDELYIEHGFSNGPPHSRQRTVLTTAEFHEVLDLAHATAQTGNELPCFRLSDTQAQQVRDQLAANALQWKDSEKSLDCLDTFFRALAGTLDVAMDAPLLASTTALPDASTIEWRDGRMVIDAATVSALQQPGSDELFARVQRDMMECLLLRTLPERTVQTSKGSHAAWLSLWQTIERIESLPPSVILTPEKRQHLRASINACEQPGSIQVMPTVGAALGHAWIRPRLSITPEKTAMGRPVGTRYMHGGGQPQPRHSTITEWPIRWLTAAEMEECHPSREAWHLELPIGVSQLESATYALEHDWKTENRQYRFAEVAPDKPASGCRISVWESVQRSMSPVIRECFDEFNRGLPLPGTPTELWERLKHFKHWLQRLASE